MIKPTYKTLKERVEFLWRQLAKSKQENERMKNIVQGNNPMHKLAKEIGDRVLVEYVAPMIGQRSNSGNLKRYEFRVSFTGGLSKESGEWVIADIVVQRFGK